MKAHLKYVKEYRDRTGKVRRYFRRAGSPATPLPGAPGSPEFVAAYSAALAGFVAVRGPERVAAAGSVSQAIAEYYAHNSFLALALGTRQHRRAILERFRAEHGDKRLAMLEPRHVEKMLGAMKPFAARNWLKALRGLMVFAVKTGLRRDDPTERYEPVKVRAGTIHAWSDSEIAQFEARYPPETRERLAMAIMFYTAARLGDAIRLGPQHIAGGRVRYTQQKTGRRLTLPVYPELSAILAAHPAEHLTLLVAAGGKPFTPASFGNWFREACRGASLPQCSSHGLRKARLRLLAESGATVSEIGAFGGHRTLSEIQRYTESADQERLADAAAKRTGREPVLSNRSGRIV